MKEVISTSEALFDEEFYLRRYPGVADAVQHGSFASGLQHYQLFGERERRVTSKEADDARRALMLGFCSLGVNCEFGIAQRMFGAEPIDLFRWAQTPPSVLIQLLSSNFDGIGDPLYLEVYATANTEYHIRHKRYKFGWHAWKNVDEATPEQIRDREAKRLPFLSRKTMDDMSEAKRIFVVARPLISTETALEVVAAMHLHGRPTLMFATEGEPLGVVRLGGYLLHATIPKFADEHAVTTTLRPEDWLEVCERACSL